MTEQIEEEKADLSLKSKILDEKAKEIEVLNALFNDYVIKTFAGGKYEDYVCQTVVELLAMNVSVNKVNDVITTVLKRFTGKSPEKLPSKGLGSQLLIKARLQKSLTKETMMKSSRILNLFGQYQRNFKEACHNIHILQKSELVRISRRGCHLRLLLPFQNQCQQQIYCWQES